MSRVCEECGARCCRYIATGIDTPTCKRDYDHIRWYLMHEKMHVFVDHENDWYLEVETPCEFLDEQGRCANYHDRPRICRKYGDDHASCEYLVEQSPYKRRFSSAAEFEAWLDKKKITWRFKAL